MAGRFGRRCRHAHELAAPNPTRGQQAYQGDDGAYQTAPP